MIYHYAYLEGEGDVHSGKDDASEHDEEGIEAHLQHEGDWYLTH